MNHPLDTKENNKEKNTFKNYDMFYMYFGFKSDKTNKSYEKNRKRDRYGLKNKTNK